MKTAIFGIWLFLVLFGTCITCVNVSLTRQVKGLQEEVIVLDSLYKQLDGKHNLYLEHLSRCAFIDRGDIEEGYQGYLRFKKMNLGHTK
jgi:hypothetical protein